MKRKSCCIPVRVTDFASHLTYERLKLKGCPCAIALRNVSHLTYERLKLCTKDDDGNNQYQSHLTYVIVFKENQPSLYDDAQAYFKAAEAELSFYSVNAKTETGKGHGRIEQRVYFLCTDTELLNLHKSWSNLNGIGMMKSRIQRNGTVTEETYYYIASLTDVKEAAKAARQHWGVENSLHWCLDMTFNEDSSRTRKDHSAENFAVIRHLALNVLKHMDDKMSVARRRRHCSYDEEYFKKVMLSIHA